MASEDGGRSDEFASGESSRRDDFLEHIDRMRRFLTSHRSIVVVRITTSDKLVPYSVRCGLPETGGTAEAIEETDWLFLAPLREVTGRQVVLN